MSTVVVLGYRQGLDEAVQRRGMTSFFVVERLKSRLAGRDYAHVARLEDAQEAALDV